MDADEVPENPEDIEDQDHHLKKLSENYIDCLEEELESNKI